MSSSTLSKRITHLTNQRNHYYFYYVMMAAFLQQSRVTPLVSFKKEFTCDIIVVMYEALKWPINYYQDLDEKLICQL
jgi:hypothetical protein